MARSNWESFSRNMSVAPGLVPPQSKGGDSFESFTLITTTDEVSLGGTGGDGGGGTGYFMDKLKAGKEWFQNKHSGSRSWGQFFNFRRLSRPSGVGEATTRLFANVKHYYINYLFVFLALTIYCVISNPILLIALALCVLTYWFVSIKNKGENVKILGRLFSPAEVYTALGIIAIPVFYIAGAGSTIFWIVGASVVLILVHAIAMVPLSGVTTDEEMGIIMEDITIS